MTVKDLIEILKTKDQTSIIFVDSDNAPSKLEYIEDETDPDSKLNWLSEEYYTKGTKAILLSSNI